MEDHRLSLLHCLLLHGLISTLLVTTGLSQSDKKSYIVYLGNLPKGESSTTSLHNNMLQDVFGSDPVAKSVLYSYKRSFNGFVVELTEDEAQKIAGVSGVVSVFPNEKKILHTTRSWDFMGFSQQVQRQTSESDVIIGVLDSGIWPESESFNDEGLGPPPDKWKGSCRTAKNFTCNKLCLENSLNPKLVKGKIVVCDRLVSGSGPLAAGAIGALFQGIGPKDAAFSFPLPASHVDTVDGSRIFVYINSASNATTTIFKSDEGNDTLAPYVVSFSSRGPNPITPDILKPDLTAPGVDILAAWSLVSSVSEASGDNRLVPFNIISGTSMACPHVSAAAAYVKSFHPTWSPAAIKSALMTTASPMSSGLNSDAEFAYGSGHLNPVKAINPGLVYDADEHDYINFLCRQGYGTQLLRQVTGDNTKCPEATNGTIPDLNYPSFAAFTSYSTTVSRVFNRTVTNVGSPLAIYRANVSFPTSTLKILVSPDVLSFTSVGEKLSYEVIIEGRMDESMVSGSLVWDDGEHQVRSPIIAFISIST
ncbi:hypothetical protein V6N13_062710 [Hibiscus sabdariffa]